MNFSELLKTPIMRITHYLISQYFFYEFLLRTLNNMMFPVLSFSHLSFFPPPTSNHTSLKHHLYYGKPNSSFLQFPVHSHRLFFLTFITYVLSKANLTLCPHFRDACKCSAGSERCNILFLDIVVVIVCGGLIPASD